MSTSFGIKLTIKICITCLLLILVGTLNFDFFNTPYFHVLHPLTYMHLCQPLNTRRVSTKCVEINTTSLLLTNYYQPSANM